MPVLAKLARDHKFALGDRILFRLLDVREGAQLDRYSDPVCVGVAETRLREKVKAAGGRWDPERKVWFLPMEQVLGLGLSDRVGRDVLCNTRKAGNA